LTEAVLIVYAAFKINDFPECYVRSIAPRKMQERLHQMRNQDHPVYRFHLAKAVGQARRTEPTPSPAGSALAPSDDESYGRLLALADQRVAEAVSALWEGGVELAEQYLATAAQDHMAGCLYLLRKQETAEERAAFQAEVERLRSLIKQSPTYSDPGAAVLPEAAKRPRALIDGHDDP